ncbi:unnamed protein product [Lathyrus oleraceus]|nr:uncharacterized protein LOC127105667 [Pisum sativum]
MGNCFTNNKILAQDDHESNNNQAKVEKMKTSSSSKFEPQPRKEKCMKKNKKVRFEIQNDDEVDRRNDGNDSRNVRRIRVVMSQEELKKMLSCKDEYENTTLEQLLGVMRLRGGQICKHDLGVDSWKPVLESIPEDQLIK